MNIKTKAYTPNSGLAKKTEFINIESNSRHKLVKSLGLFLLFLIVLLTLMYIITPEDYKLHPDKYGVRRSWLTYRKYVLLTAVLSLSLLFAMTFLKIIRKISIDIQSDVLYIEYIERFGTKVTNKTVTFSKVQLYIDKWPGQGTESTILKLIHTDIGTITITETDFGKVEFQKLLDLTKNYH